MTSRDIILHDSIDLTHRFKGMSLAQKGIALFHKKSQTRYLVFLLAILFSSSCKVTKLEMDLLVEKGWKSSKGEHDFCELLHTTKWITQCSNCIAWCLTCLFIYVWFSNTIKSMGNMLYKWKSLMACVR